MDTEEDPLIYAVRPWMSLDLYIYVHIYAVHPLINMSSSLDLDEY